MLHRAWLAVVFIVLYTCIFAQADSLFVQPLADSTLVVVPQVSKAEVAAWINEHNRSITANVFDNIPLYADYGDIYHSGYYYIGRPNVQMPSRLGFEQIPGAFASTLYHGYYYSLYPQSSGINTVDYSNEEYPFAPALSSIRASLGDYEHHYAHVSLKKNSLFSYPGVCYQGDLLVQSGVWTDIVSAETSQKHYLSISGSNVTVEAEYASLAKDIAMTELMPVYWQNTNFSIAHQLKHYYAAIKHPNAELSIINSNESASAREFARNLKQRSTQMKLALVTNAGIYQCQAYYEHALNHSNSAKLGMFSSQTYQNKLGMEVKGFMPWGYSLKADYLDWKQGRLYADLDLPLGSYNFGAYTAALIGSEASPDSVISIYNLTDYLPLLGVSVRREQAVFCRYTWQGISGLVAGGSKNIRQKSTFSWLDSQDEQLFIRIAIDIKQRWGKWELQARPQWVWTKADAPMVESPEFRFQSGQNLIYHLPWNNSLLAGFGVSGHSGYYAANAVLPFLIEASTVLDAWAGFDIDSFFQFRAGVKNALSSTIYAASPVPWALYAELKWLYLN